MSGAPVIFEDYRLLPSAGSPYNKDERPQCCLF